VVPRTPGPPLAIDSGAAVAAGLTFRPARNTARDVLSEIRDAGRLDDLRAGLPAARERALLRTLPRAAGAG